MSPVVQSTDCIQPIELGVDATLARSNVDTTGRDLMAQHFKKQAYSGIQMGGESSAFRPIKLARLEPETDEEKLGMDSGKPYHLVKPTPMIYVNDSELQLSPLPSLPTVSQN